MTNAVIVEEVQAIQAKLNDDNLPLDEKMNLIDKLVELKSQSASANNTSANSTNIAEDPVLDLMCGDACQ